MHRVLRTIRRIELADLPQVRDIATDELRAATDDELLNMDIVHLADDLYAVQEQIRSDDVDASGNREWKPVDEPKKGVVLSGGDAVDRFQRLPADVKPQILQARVIRSPDPAVNVRELAEANILEQQAVIEDVVGEVVLAEGGAPQPLVDFEQGDPVLAEAQRLAEIPDNGIERVTVRMADVDTAADVVERDGLIPHAWAGERIPT